MTPQVQQAQTAPTNPELPPPGTPSAYQPRVAIGNVPRWLLQNIIVTKDPNDIVEEEDIIRALSRQYPRDEIGHWSGHTRTEVFTRARELIPGFPRVTSVSIPGTNSRVRKAMLKGIRLLQPVTNEERNAAPHTATKYNTQPQPPKAPQRTCRSCGTPIDDRHFNALTCQECGNQEKPLKERICHDCQANIAHRNSNALRCETCAPIHNARYAALHRAKPHVKRARTIYNQKPENIARAKQNAKRKKSTD